MTALVQADRSFPAAPAVQIDHDAKGRYCLASLPAGPVANENAVTDRSRSVLVARRLRRSRREARV